MEKKMTKRNYFELIKANFPADNENYEKVVAFIDHEIELLARKNSSEKKPTAVQLANEKLKDVIADVLKASDKPMMVSEIMKADSELSELTNQKVSALVRQMKEDGIVEKIEDKRKSYFKLV